VHILASEQRSATSVRWVKSRFYTSIFQSTVNSSWNVTLLVARHIWQWFTLLVGNFKSLAAGPWRCLINNIPFRHARCLAPGGCFGIPVLGIGVRTSGADSVVGIVRPWTHVGLHVLHHLPAHWVRPRWVEPRAAWGPVFAAALRAYRIELHCPAAVWPWAWCLWAWVVVRPVEVNFPVHWSF
jgi:hypothetical protein